VLKQSGGDRHNCGFHSTSLGAGLFFASHNYPSASAEWVYTTAVTPALDVFPGLLLPTREAGHIHRYRRKKAEIYRSENSQFGTYSPKLSTTPATSAISIGSTTASRCASPAHPIAATRRTEHFRAAASNSRLGSIDRISSPISTCSSLCQLAVLSIAWLRFH
jgi:hypothetical protein